MPIGLIIISILVIFITLILKRQIAKRVKEISIRNEQFSQIINLVPHIIYVADDMGNILLANKKAGQYFGMTEEEMDRCSINNYKNQHNVEKQFLNDSSLNQLPRKIDMEEIETEDFKGNQHSLLLSKVPFFGFRKKNKAHVTVAVDITEIKKYEEKTKQLAYYNQVTKLPNKILFKSKLEQSIKEFETHKKYGSLLYIDLDAFKKINDSQGYAFGDKLLKILVKRFTTNLQDYKTIAHLGGDEFVIDVPELHNERVVAEVLAVQFAEFVQAIISKQITSEDIVFQLSACVGIVIYPKDGNSETKLMQRAGTALNKAKNLGTNKLHLFDKTLEREIKSNMLLESELRHALDKEQFIVFYQPITAHNKIVGAEALVRWNHPAKGIIGPADFIEVVEKNRLIVRLGDWILEQACQKIQDNIIAGKKEFYIAVNVSVLQIKNKYFYQRVSSLIKKYNIPSNHIELEITESVLMEDIELSISLFNKLKLLGIKISIDDFGTGYSSFSYLTKLPIDKIKIDQSFVKALPKDSNSATIVRTIIKMSHELGMKVVSEGIENEEQYKFLIKEGCQFFQGYYLHKPMQYSDLEKLY